MVQEYIKILQTIWDIYKICQLIRVGATISKLRLGKIRILLINSNKVWYKVQWLINLQGEITLLSIQLPTQVGNLVT